MKDLLKTIRKEQVLLVLYTVVIIAGLLKVNSNEYISTFSMPSEKKVIMIDAGHGGWDPGKVGYDGILEKDINLEIAKKLQTNLELGGAFVVTTRISDTALSEEKRKDLDKRKSLSNESGADIVISIHQNSYPNSRVKGAQVFYYNDSENSKLLAECIQDQFIAFLDPGNKRVAKANEDYYMLKKTTIPAVIVECGFLTNRSEGLILTDDTYQEKVAWSIYMGIVDYFKQKSDS